MEAMVLSDRASRTGTDRDRAPTGREAGSAHEETAHEQGHCWHTRVDSRVSGIGPTEAAAA